MVCPECNGRGETIYYVETNRDENTVMLRQRKGICQTCNGSGKKLMTNADKIRAMSDEELDCFLLKVTYGMDKCPYEYGSEKSIEWLKQPAEGE